jgi:hypothetical protein
MNAFESSSVPRGKVFAVALMIGGSDSPNSTTIGIAA